jgi:hypothetical protein
MNDDKNFQKYLDERFNSLEKVLDQNHRFNKLELKQIKENTEKTNGKVADQERRIRELENKRLSCPIGQVVDKQKKIENETENVRAYAKVFKTSFVLAFISFIGLILRIFNVI